MFAIETGHAAMPMAHVFAKTDVRNYHHLRATRLNCPNCLLNNPVIGISAAGLLIFIVRDSEENNRLQPAILNLASFISDVAEGQLKDAGHARDRAAFGKLLANEQG